MTSKRRQFFSGNSLEQALMQAARHYEIEPNEVAYKMLEKRHGFLRVRRAVMIEVDPDSPRKSTSERVEIERPDQPPAREPLAQDDLTSAVGTEATVEDEGDDEEADDQDHDEGDSREELPEATGKLADAARQALQLVLEFTGLELQAEVLQGDGQLEIELSGADRDRLVKDRGELLLAIQHLLPRLIRGLAQESIPCRVDSGDFHATRRSELKQVAEEAAAAVRRERRPRSLRPMNPAERRIVHLALAEDPDVVTESEGKGFYKRVTIKPAIVRPRGFDRYSR